MTIGGISAIVAITVVVTILIIEMYGLNYKLLKRSIVFYFMIAMMCLDYGAHVMYNHSDLVEGFTCRHWICKTFGVLHIENIKHHNLILLFSAVPLLLFLVIIYFRFRNHLLRKKSSVTN